MTIVPIRRRLTPTRPLNHSAYVCEDCNAVPLREHGFACPQASGLAYPAEARIFRGLPGAIAISIALFWAPLAALLIWSH